MEGIRFRITTFVSIFAILMLAVFSGCTTANRTAPPTDGNRMNTTDPNRVGQQLNEMVPGTNNMPGVNALNDNDLRARNNTGNNAVGNGDIDKSKAISQRLMTMDNVGKASVMVVGNMAFVGIQPKDPAKNIGITGNNINGTANNVGYGMNKEPDDDDNRRDGYVTDRDGIIGDGNNAGNTVNREPAPNNAKIGNGAINSVDINSRVSQMVKSVDPTVTRVYVTTETDLVNRIDRISNTMATEMSDLMNRMR